MKLTVEDELLIQVTCMSAQVVTVPVYVKGMIESVNTLRSLKGSEMYKNLTADYQNIKQQIVDALAEDDGDVGE